ncbi:MAG: Asp-tRNA(Asn)/Glu-tRNA(Gln) amidotransferase subunit GatC [Gammaproteobacteria bacterium]
MALQRSEVARVAGLAHIAMDDAELDAVTADLAAILGLVEQMNAVDTAGAEPLAHPLEMHARLRADAVSEPDRRDALMAVAPQVEAHLFLVPKVIE